MCILVGGGLSPDWTGPDYLQPQDSTTMLGRVFTVAVLLESMTTSCSEEYCLAVQQGTNSSDLLVPLVERIFCKEIREFN